MRPAGEVPPASLVSPAVPAPRPLLESELRPAQAAPAVRVPAANREPARRVAPSPPPKLEVIAEPSPAGSPVLRIQGLSAECERRQILQGIDLELAPRGLYALIGGSGAGKSALLGVLSGRHRAASGWSLTGSIWYCNLPLGATTRPAVLGAEVTRASLSLRGYLLADLDEGMADRFSTPLLLQLLERVSLSALAPYLSETLGGPRLRLSTGEWRRLAIARELAASPPLLCLDDAFVGLSEDDSEVLWSVLQSQARERAVLYSEQQPPRVGLPLSQVFCLQHGQLRQMGLAGEPSAAAAESSAKAPEKPPTEPAVSSAPAGSGVAPVSPASGAASPAETSQGTTGLEAPRLRPAAARPVSKGTDGVIWASTAPILRLRNFGIVVNGRPQLANINLDLPDCGLHLLVGRDGPQRRMLLRALCGLHGGQLQLIGDALFGGGALSEEHGLGCLSPNPRLSLLTVREHLVHGPTLWQGGARHERGQRALRLLEQSGFPELESLLDQPLCDLGTYERRVVEILAPLSASPLALALHDVVAGVDAARRPRLLRLLADQAARRAILLFTDEPQPYLAFAFTPPARQAWLTGDHIVADEPG